MMARKLVTPSAVPQTSHSTPLPTWALVVCTYRRADVLMRCLRAAVRQTVPPVEVVVVDASPDWAETRGRVMREVAGEGPSLKWQYVAADVAGLPAQRNQGIGLARADVLFMIDDDSIMYPDCAEEVLKVYAADVGGRIAAVGAVPVAGEPPDGAGMPAKADPTVWRSVGSPSWVSRVRWWISLPFDRGERSFLPYGGEWPAQVVPSECLHLGVEAARTLNGYRMTFRRGVIAKVGFTGMLAGSPPFEDVEATHRASLHGAVVNAPRARLCHLTWDSGRLNRMAYSALWVTNGAALHVLYGRDKRALERAWRRRTGVAMCLHLVKDLAKRRWGFPEFRGIWRGRRMLDRIYVRPPEELTRWYPRVQSVIRRWRESE